MEYIFIAKISPYTDFKLPFEVN